MKKIPLSTVIAAMRSEKMTWTSPEVILYIKDYAERHPEQKMTKRLMRKLERQYWRSVRARQKRSK